MTKCIFNWSGGKDSALALYYCLQDPQIEIKYLVTTVNAMADRVAMHGVRVSLLKAQAERIGIPLYQIRMPEMPDMETYDKTMSIHLKRFADEGVTHAIYGDIHLEDLKNYRDERLAEVGLTGIYPLWKRDTKELIDEFFALGFGTVIACAQEKLAENVGEELTTGLISTFPADVDICGENGEFHTFAFKGPIFSLPIMYQRGDKVYREFAAPKDHNNQVNDVALSGFWYCDLLPS